MQLGTEADPGFSKGWFAEALAALDRFPDSEFARYGVDAATIDHVRETMRSWSREVTRAVERQQMTPDAAPPLEKDTPASPPKRHQAQPSPNPAIGRDPGLESPYREGPEIEL
jgi:hypothetical protein